MGVRSLLRYIYLHHTDCIESNMLQSLSKCRLAVDGNNFMHYVEAKVNERLMNSTESFPDGEYVLAMMCNVLVHYLSPLLNNKVYFVVVMDGKIPDLKVNSSLARNTMATNDTIFWSEISARQSQLQTYTAHNKSRPTTSGVHGSAVWAEEEHATSREGLRKGEGEGEEEEGEGKGERRSCERQVEGEELTKGRHLSCQCKITDGKNNIADAELDLHELYRYHSYNLLSATNNSSLSNEEGSPNETPCTITSAIENTWKVQRKRPLDGKRRKMAKGSQSSLGSVRQSCSPPALSPSWRRKVSHPTVSPKGHPNINSELQTATGNGRYPVQMHQTRHKKGSRWRRSTSRLTRSSECEHSSRSLLIEEEEEEEEEGGGGEEEEKKQNTDRRVYPRLIAGDSYLITYPSVAGMPKNQLARISTTAAPSETVSSLPTEGLHTNSTTRHSRLKFDHNLECPNGWGSNHHSSTRELNRCRYKSRSSQAPQKSRSGRNSSSLFKDFFTNGVFAHEGVQGRHSSKLQAEVFQYNSDGSGVVHTNDTYKCMNPMERKCYFIDMMLMMGIPVIRAEGEAEMTCCALLEENIVSGIISRDTDHLVLGCSNLIISLRSNCIEYLNVNKLLHKLDLSRREFVDFCILCGTDYNSPSNGYTRGLMVPDKALSTIHSYRNIEQAMQHVNLPATKFLEVREIYRMKGDLLIGVRKSTSLCTPSYSVWKDNRWIMESIGMLSTAMQIVERYYN